MVWSPIRIAVYLPWSTILLSGKQQMFWGRHNRTKGNAFHIDSPKLHCCFYQITWIHLLKEHTLFIQSIFTWNPDVPSPKSTDEGAGTLRTTMSSLPEWILPSPSHAFRRVQHSALVDIWSFLPLLLRKCTHVSQKLTSSALLSLVSNISPISFIMRGLNALTDFQLLPISPITM